MRAFIIVDMQNDFIDGSLAVVGAEEIIAKIIWRANGDHKGSVIALSRDWHPANHVSFKDFPDFIDNSWPPHCVQDTYGAEINQRINAGIEYDVIASKGTNPNKEQYSALDGVTNLGPSLHRYLIDKDVNEVEIVGLALDYCVRATALDAIGYGYTTSVYLPGTAAVNPLQGINTIEEFIRNGITLTA